MPRLASVQSEGLEVPLQAPGRSREVRGADGEALDLAWRHGRAALLELRLMLDALRDAGADPNMRSDVKLMAVDLAWTTGKIAVAQAGLTEPGQRSD